MPEVAGGAKGEVVTPQDTMSPLRRFAERIKTELKEAYIKEVNEDTGLIKITMNNIQIILEPQLERNGELIYTSIQINYYNFDTNSLETLTLDSREIYLELSDKVLKCKYKEIYEDPIMLVNERELVEYLNELSKINDFSQFAEEEFKTWSGLY